MADFSYSPNYVHVHPPVPNVEVSPNKNFKQTVYKLDGNWIEKFTLHFGDNNLTDRDLLLAHFQGQFGPFTQFSWTNPPAYVTGSPPLTVRYDIESPGRGYEVETPAVGGQIFTINLHFLKVV